MVPPKPTVRLANPRSRPGHATVTVARGRVWDRVFGTGLAVLGFTLVLAELPLVLVAPLAGVILIAGGALWATRGPLEGRATGTAVMAFGFVLLVPLLGLAPVATYGYKILVGSGLALFGIVKLTA